MRQFFVCLWLQYFGRCRGYHEGLYLTSMVWSWYKEPKHQEQKRTKLRAGREAYDVFQRAGFFGAPKPSHQVGAQWWAVISVKIFLQDSKTGFMNVSQKPLAYLSKWMEYTRCAAHNGHKFSAWWWNCSIHSLKEVAAWWVTLPLATCFRTMAHMHGTIEHRASTSTFTL